MDKFSLLLVEDNEDDRFLTTRIIKKLPFAVDLEICKNGDDAFKRILTNSLELPALILLDLQLPKMGGIDLLAKIRGTYTAKELPVIILSSSDNPGDIALCKELGISGYLSKPPELQALLTHLQMVLPLSPTPQ
ncbi:MAG: response regulator [Geobacteraceae bacterium]|nr:response regulator [Geobacteraceae bacterium]